MDDWPFFDTIREGYNNNRKGYDINYVVMQMIEAVHNGWIKDNADLFFTKKQDKGQQYQYLPIELIGWDEVKSDLLFIKPIIERMHGKINEEALKKELHDRTISYVSNGVLGHNSQSYANFEDIGQNIVEEGEGIFYGKCPWTEEIRQAFKNEEFVQSVIIPQIKEKGIGKDYELMNKMAKTPNYESVVNYDGDAPNQFIPIFFDVDWNEKNLAYDRVAHLLFGGEENGTYDSEELAELDEEELAEFTKIKSNLFKMRQSPLFEEENDLLEELEDLRDKKQKLQEQAKTISETEKLIDAKENQGPNLDE